MRFNLSLTLALGAAIILFGCSGSNPTSSDPLAVQFLSPSNGATAVSTSPTLSWKSWNGSNSYRVTLSTSPSFSYSTEQGYSTSGTSLQVTGLNTLTTYYWQVWAYTGGDSSSDSGYVWSFTTN